MIHLEVYYVETINTERHDFSYAMIRPKYVHTDKYISTFRTIDGLVEAIKNEEMIKPPGNRPITEISLPQNPKIILDHNTHTTYKLVPMPKIDEKYIVEKLVHG
jgi:hypothetical protein